MIWTVHFIASYWTIAIGCAKSMDPDSIRMAIVAYTVVAIFLIAVVALRSYRRHRVGEATMTHDFDSVEEQNRFLSFAAFLLAMLSGIATLFTALVVVFLRTCD